jgi:hypothetical protein
VGVPGKVDLMAFCVLELGKIAAGEYEDAEGGDVIVGRATSALRLPCVTPVMRTVCGSGRASCQVND